MAPLTAEYPGGSGVHPITMIHLLIMVGKWFIMVDNGGFIG